MGALAYAFDVHAISINASNAKNERNDPGYSKRSQQNVDAG
jgi:hypothetical protein